MFSCFFLGGGGGHLVYNTWGALYEALTKFVSEGACEFDMNFRNGDALPRHHLPLPKGLTHVAVAAPPRRCRALRHHEGNKARPLRQSLVQGLLESLVREQRCLRPKPVRLRWCWWRPPGQNILWRRRCCRSSSVALGTCRVAPRLVSQVQARLVCGTPPVVRMNLLGDSSVRPLHYSIS